MTSYYGDYTTLLDVRGTLVGTTKTGNDTLYLDLIHSTSQEMDDISNRRFVPWITTEYYDTPSQQNAPIEFDDDLLAVLSLTNGDGSAISASAYKLYPLNAWPKEKVVLLSSSAIGWRLSTLSDKEGAIAVNGIYGYHDDYPNAWRSADTLNGAIDGVVTAITTTGSAIIKAGQLIQIDSEFLYASAVAGTTITAVRGVNGSTAAAHLTLAPVSVWTQRDIEMTCRYAVLAYERLKNNPSGDTVTIGQYSFSTPKDVVKFLEMRLGKMGVVRTGFY